MPVNASDQRLKSSARSTGIPIIWAITATGKGVVKALTISTDLPAGMFATRSSAILDTSPSIALSIRVVKALLTIPRSWVWRGGSSANKGKGPASPPMALEEKASESFSTARTSSCRVRIQAPVSSSCQSGWSARHVAKKPYGFSSSSGVKNFMSNLLVQFTVLASIIASSPDKIENNGELFRPSSLYSGNH